MKILSWNWSSQDSILRQVPLSNLFNSTNYKFFKSFFSDIVLLKHEFLHIWKVVVMCKSRYFDGAGAKNSALILLTRYLYYQL